MSSRHDWAVTVTPSQVFSSDTHYMGGHGAWKHAARSPGDVFTVDPEDPGRRVLMIDASHAVCGHSDVLEAWVGWRMAQLVARHASPAGPVRIGAEPQTQGCR